VHGVANMLAGAVGTLQNYLCFSNSALYYKCGGGGLLYRGLLSVTVFVFFLVGPSVISIIPRCMAGALMLHIGTELVREALVEPFASLDRIEYASVCLITLVMTVAGMTQGLVVAAILALLTFVLQSSRVPVVASWGHGARVRSSSSSSRASSSSATSHRCPLPSATCSPRATSTHTSRLCPETNGTWAISTS